MGASGEDRNQILLYTALGLMLTHAMAVMGVAIACVIVMLMKGDARVADAYVLAELPCDQ